MDRGAWKTIVHGVAKSGTRLNRLTRQKVKTNHRSSLLIISQGAVLAPRGCLKSLPCDTQEFLFVLLSFGYAGSLLFFMGFL